MRPSIAPISLDNASNLAAYRRLAPGYDLLFGRILQDGRRKAIQRLACAPGDKVLELGVGTGLALPLYPAGTHVLGVDLSEAMLVKAQARIEAMGLRDCTVSRQNAMSLTLADGSFDKVVALYIASVVPDPLRLLDEMRRVCTPGGDLIVVNHFASPSVAGRWAEALVAPLCPFFGFKSDLALGPLLASAGWEGARVERVNSFGYWRLIHWKKPVF